MARLRAWCASPSFKPTKARRRRTSGSVIHAIMNRERSKVAAVRCSMAGAEVHLPRLPVGPPIRPVIVEVMPSIPSPVAFETRRANRAQREARVALAAMQVPFETRDRRGQTVPPARQLRHP